MTISLQYIGTMKPYFETAATAKARSWMPGQQQDVSDADAALLVATGMFSAPQPKDGAWIPINGNYTISSFDDRKSFACTTALTVTIPTGLSPRPSVCILPPPTGNLLSITGPLNGSSQTLTRTRGSNVAGVAINAYPDADNYGVSGS